MMHRPSVSGGGKDCLQKKSGSLLHEGDLKATPTHGGIFFRQIEAIFGRASFQAGTQLRMVTMGFLQ